MFTLSRLIAGKFITSEGCIHKVTENLARAFMLTGSKLPLIDPSPIFSNLNQNRRPTLSICWCINAAHFVNRPILSIIYTHHSSNNDKYPMYIRWIDIPILTRFTFHRSDFTISFRPCNIKWLNTPNFFCPSLPSEKSIASCSCCRFIFMLISLVKAIVIISSE